MADTLIDIFNNIIKYKNKEITIIMDDMGTFCFSAINVANLLGYRSIRSNIIKIVNKSHQTSFDKLKKFVNIIPKNTQPHAIYINEHGLYDLCIESRKPIAKDFRKWITQQSFHI